MTRQIGFLWFFASFFYYRSCRILVKKPIVEKPYQRSDRSIIKLFRVFFSSKMKVKSHVNPNRQRILLWTEIFYVIAYTCPSNSPLNIYFVFITKYLRHNRYLYENSRQIKTTVVPTSKHTQTVYLLPPTCIYRIVRVYI